ncbi:hypothetical protein [Psychrobacter sp.]|uniref:hypothetical protein n=1 Tax=Psychrobacter sp. TaxID=56811 RepID=UPI0025CCCB23|nr:hypothetical protein [Psychrobacter sp.]
MSNNELNQEADSIEKALDNEQEPESLAEATTATLDDDALGRHATEDDKPKKK